MNKTIFNKMNELIQQDYPRFTGLIDLGSCTIHTVHNAFGKGIEQYGLEIDLLCKDLYTLFQHSAARCEDYVGVQIEMEVEIHNFQQHRSEVAEYGTFHQKSSRAVGCHNKVC